MIDFTIINTIVIWIVIIVCGIMILRGILGIFYTRHTSNKKVDEITEKVFKTPEGKELKKEIENYIETNPRILELMKELKVLGKKEADDYLKEQNK